MTNLSRNKQFRNYSDRNLKDWVREHAGEYVMVTISDGQFVPTFFNREQDYQRARRKCQSFSFGERIPNKYIKPDSLLSLVERAKRVRGETIRYLRKLDAFEKRSIETNSEVRFAV